MNKSQSIPSNLHSILDGCADGFVSLFEHKDTGEHEASFAKPWQVGASRFNHGFCIDGLHFLTKKDSYMNASVFGFSGSGKGVSVVVPSIFSLIRGRSSIIVHDPSSETLSIAAPALHKAAYDIQVFNPSDPEHSESFNPLAYCHDWSEIKKLSHVHVRNALGDAKGEVFWNTSSELLYSMFGKYLVEYAPKEVAHIASILRLLEQFSAKPELVDKLFVATHDEALLSSYRAANSMGDRTLASVVANTRAVLSLFQDESIVRTTSANTIDFAKLRSGDRPTALFISTPIKDQSYYRPLSAMFFETLFNELMHHLPDKNDRSVYILIDEASSLRFSALGTVISNIRKYRCGIMLVLQDYQALVAQYGAAEAHNIRTNTYAQIYLKGQNLDSCRELEAILGKRTIEDKRGKRTQNLMNVQNIRTSKDAIILLGNNLPLKRRMVPYFEHLWFRYLSQLPPYPLPKKPIVDPPMIQFNG